MIYFVQAIDGGPIKIGTTVDLDARLKALESHYGRPLALLHAMEGGRAEEAEIHARFAHLRLGRTEQFRPDPDLMRFIRRPIFVNQGDVPLMEPVSELKAVRLELPLEVHRQLRIEAARRDQSMSALARSIVEEFLIKQSGKGGKK